MKKGYNLEIVVSTSFIGYHRWKKAPKETDFLRSMHRHKFFVKLTVSVNHNDREIEFFDIQDKLNKYIQLHFENKKDIGSCEMIGSKILTYIESLYPNRIMSILISEDNENGAIISNK